MWAAKTAVMKAGEMVDGRVDPKVCLSVVLWAWNLVDVKVAMRVVKKVVWRADQMVSLMAGEMVAERAAGMVEM